MEQLVQEYCELMSQFRTKGNAWIPSERELMMRKLYEDNRDKFVSGDQLQPGKTYLITEGVGVMVDGYSEYFQRGALAKFGEHDGATIEIEVSGDTFKVTQDASFGNTLAKFIAPTRKATGTCNARRACCIDLADAIETIKRHRCA